MKGSPNGCATGTKSSVSCVGLPVRSIVISGQDVALFGEMNDNS
jgi:hypothetical protein